jgi:hypothetical protein
MWYKVNFRVASAGCEVGFYSIQTEYTRGWCGLSPPIHRTKCHHDAKSPGKNLTEITALAVTPNKKFKSLQHSTCFKALI